MRPDSGAGGYQSPARYAEECVPAHGERDIPSRTDAVARDFSHSLGGPIGRHAVIGRQKYLTPVRFILLVALVFLALGWSTKAGCLQQHISQSGPDKGRLALDWDGNRPFTAMCYSDIIPLYTAEKLNDKKQFPYLASWFDNQGQPNQVRRYMEYPVLTGMYMYVSARVADVWMDSPLPKPLAVVAFFTIVALGLALFWLVTVWATAILAGRRIWSAMLAAASPLVMVHAFTNFDAIATALLALAMLFWAKKNPVLAGAFIGLGMAAKLYPAFLLLPLLVLCLRSGKMRQFGITALTAVAVWLAVNLPFMVVAPRGWWEFIQHNTQRGPDPDTLYNALSVFGGVDWGADKFGQSNVVNWLSLLLFVAVCAAIAYVGLSAPTRPRVAQLMFLVVAGFLITNKVWSPQYSLWLVPLAVLAIPHTRILLAWMAVDAFVWVPRMGMYLGVQHKGVPPEWFVGAVLVRDIAVLALCALVVYQIYRPDQDLVRGKGLHTADDPIGGVLDRAPDVLRLRGLRLRRDARQEPLAAVGPVVVDH